MRVRANRAATADSRRQTVPRTFVCSRCCFAYDRRERSRIFQRLICTTRERHETSLLVAVSRLPLPNLLLSYQFPIDYLLFCSCFFFSRIYSFFASVRMHGNTNEYTYMCMDALLDVRNCVVRFVRTSDNQMIAAAHLHGRLRRSMAVTHWSVIDFDLNTSIFSGTHKWRSPPRAKHENVKSMFLCQLFINKFKSYFFAGRSRTREVGGGGDTWTTYSCHKCTFWINGWSLLSPAANNRPKTQCTDMGSIGFKCHRMWCINIIIDNAFIFIVCSATAAHRRISKKRNGNDGPRHVHCRSTEAIRR